MGWYWLMNGMWLRVAKLWRDYIIKIINRHLCYDKYKMYNIKILITNTVLFNLVGYNNTNAGVMRHPIGHPANIQHFRQTIKQDK